MKYKKHMHVKNKDKVIDNIQTKLEFIRREIRDTDLVKLGEMPTSYTITMLLRIVDAANCIAFHLYLNDETENKPKEKVK